MARVEGVSSQMSNSPSGRGKAGLAILLQYNNFMRLMNEKNAFEIAPTTYQFYPVTSSANLQVRAINGGFTASNMALASPITDSLYIYGDAQDWDVSYDRDDKLGFSKPEALFQKKLQRRMIDFAKKLQIAMFNDPGTDNKMKGLSKILDGTNTFAGTTDTRVKNAANYSKASTPKNLDLSGVLDDTKVNGFIEMMFQILSDVDGEKILVINESLAAKINMIGWRNDLLGKEQFQTGKFSTFMDMPFAVVPNDVILNTEPDDSATPVNCTTSMYLMSPAETRFSIVTNSGLAWTDYDKLEDKQAKREVMEFALNYKIEDEKSILRVRNIKL